MKTNKRFGQFVAHQVIRKIHDGSAMKKSINLTEVLTNLGLKEGDIVFEPLLIRVLFLVHPQMLLFSPLAS